MNYLAVCNVAEIEEKDFDGLLEALNKNKNCTLEEKQCLAMSFGATWEYKKIQWTSKSLQAKESRM